MQETISIAKRECDIFYRKSEVPDILLVQPMGEHERQGMRKEYEYILAGTKKHFMLVAVRITDWNGELSPWQAPAVWRNQDFAGLGEITLRDILDNILPEVLVRYHLPEKTPIILGGYSLAGLFALWAAYQTNRFCGVAAVSPSVWFPGWMEYIADRTIQTQRIYLSLGKKEEKAGNRQMAVVGDNLRQMYEWYQKQASPAQVTLEWNEGNHFREPELRTAKGFLWANESISCYNSTTALLTERKR